MRDHETEGGDITHVDAVTLGGRQSIEDLIRDSLRAKSLVRQHDGAARGACIAGSLQSSCVKLPTGCRLTRETNLRAVEMANSHL